MIETQSELFFFNLRCPKVLTSVELYHTKLVLSIRGPYPMSSAGLCNVCHGGRVCHRYQDHGKQIKEMDFAAQATSSSHNQSLAFSLALPPKRQPSDDLILLWSLSSRSFFPSHLPVSLFHRDGSLDPTAVWFDLCINDFRIIISCLLCLVGLPLTFLNVKITTGFSFCMIIFYILK